VILADEPTASLDAKAGDVVIEILLQLSRDGRTVIAISHDLALLERFGSTIALDHGRIAGQHRQAAP
jgi:ABC-type lipoprotein export system ATPase subunit